MKKTLSEAVSIVVSSTAATLTIETVATPMMAWREEEEDTKGKVKKSPLFSKQMGFVF